MKSYLGTNLHSIQSKSRVAKPVWRVSLSRQVLPSIVLYIIINNSQTEVFPYTEENSSPRNLSFTIIVEQLIELTSTICCALLAKVIGFAGRPSP